MAETERKPILTAGNPLDIKKRVPLAALFEADSPHFVARAEFAKSRGPESCESSGPLKSEPFNCLATASPGYSFRV